MTDRRTVLPRSEQCLGVLHVGLYAETSHDANFPLVDVLTTRRTTGTTTYRQSTVTTVDRFPTCPAASRSEPPKPRTESPPLLAGNNLTAGEPGISLAPCAPLPEESQTVGYLESDCEAPGTSLRTPATKLSRGGLRAGHESSSWRAVGYRTQS